MRAARGRVALLGVAAVVVRVSVDAGALAAQAPDAPVRARVDSVFQRFDRTDSPGCALLVRRDGRTAYARGYGMASLELGVAITPQTVMDIGSTSKQFTAAAVWLLAQEGKLKLDDEVQQHLTALPRLSAPVTIRHMLQHTSGWRDYNDLLALAGASEEEVTTAGDAMALLARQKAGNFAPGTWWTYSNTGFFVAGQIVEQVSGMPMRRFLRERFFVPLGMTHTDLFDDHARIFRNKAPSYAPGPDGWQVSASNWEQTGDGAVQTSVEDLAKWDANFDDPAVGGRALVDSMQQSGRLVDGTPFTYAYGLTVDRYRGVRRVHHGGAWAGYRAMSMRFPDQRASVYLTCNAANANTMALAEGVADAILSAALGPPVAVRLADSLRAPAAAVIAPLHGLWWDPTVGRLTRITVRDTVATVGSPFGGPARRLMQLPDGRLVATPVLAGGARLHFDKASGQLVADNASGPSDHFTHVDDASPLTAAKLAEYAGRYATPEMPSVWTIEAKGDSLVLATVSGARQSRERLQPLFADAFHLQGQPIRFVRDARGKVIALSVTNRGVRDLRWLRAP